MPLPGGEDPTKAEPEVAVGSRVAFLRNRPVAVGKRTAYFPEPEPEAQ